MGGHQAWRKRVAAGELAKGSGGAALRHRPRLGRKGVEERKLNRLGNIGGRPNPKKKKIVAQKKRANITEECGKHDTLVERTILRRTVVGMLLCYAGMAGVGLLWLSRL